MISFTLTPLWTTLALIQLVYPESIGMLFVHVDRGCFLQQQSPPKSFVSIFFEFLSV